MLNQDLKRYSVPSKLDEVAEGSKVWYVAIIIMQLSSVRVDKTRTNEYVKPSDMDLALSLKIQW